jgi:multidrug efflux pump subunit AcrA (membrane-fusion protein)
MKRSVLFPAFARLRFLALLGILALLAACQPSAPASGPTASAAGSPAGGSPGGRRAATVAVQAETVKYGPLQVQNSTAGTVVADIQSSVAAQIAGTVTVLVRKAGDWVKAGDPVIRLDESQLLLALKIAQANLNTAKLNAGVKADGSFDENSKSKLQLQAAQKTYDSDLALSKIGGIADSDLETAQANLEAAKIAVQQDPISVNTAALQVQQAQLNLAWATVRAPFAGQIVSINVEPGEYVATNTTAFVIASLAKDVDFSVPPSEVVGLTHGAKITFSQDGKTNPISLIGVPSAPVNGLVPLQAALPAGFPGAFGTVGSVAYSQVMATGTLVPIPAIQTLENSTYVFTIKNNKAARADISVLADSGIYAAVTGLADGDTVIVNPPPGLLVGAPIRVLQAVGAAAQAQPAALPANGGGR